MTLFLTAVMRFQLRELLESPTPAHIHSPPRSRPAPDALCFALFVCRGKQLEGEESYVSEGQQDRSVALKALNGPLLSHVIVSCVLTEVIDGGWRLSHRACGSEFPCSSSSLPVLTNHQWRLYCAIRAAASEML